MRGVDAQRDFLRQARQPMGAFGESTFRPAPHPCFAALGPDGRQYLDARIREILSAGESIISDNADRLTSCLVLATEERP